MILFTGGWSIIDNAMYKAQGFTFRINSLGGMLTHDFSMFMERDFTPQFDFTPNYLVNLSNEIFSMGAGVAFHHYLPVAPSKLSPKTERNTVLTFAAAPNEPFIVTGNTFEGFDTLTAAEFPAQGFVSDLKTYKDGDGESIIEKQLYQNIADPNIVVTQHDAGYMADTAAYAYIGEFLPRDTVRYTFKAIKLMAKASLSLRNLMGLDNMNPEDLKIFLEIALLGVENYPIIYENRMDRVPIMAGINLPTFGLLDIFSVQMEYNSSPFPNNYNAMREFSVPTYDISDFAKNYNPDDYKSDDMKWSIYTKKRVIPGMNIYLQVARDHFRTITYYNKPNPNSLMKNKSDWYYMFKLAWGI